jgi:hypothetical protein
MRNLRSRGVGVGGSSVKERRAVQVKSGWGQSEVSISLNVQAGACVA